MGSTGRLGALLALLAGREVVLGLVVRVLAISRWDLKQAPHEHLQRIRLRGARRLGAGDLLEDGAPHGALPDRAARMGQGEGIAHLDPPFRTPLKQGCVQRCCENIL